MVVIEVKKITSSIGFKVSAEVISKGRTEAALRQTIDSKQPLEPADSPCSACGGRVPKVVGYTMARTQKKNKKARKNKPE